MIVIMVVAVVAVVCGGVDIDDGDDHHCPPGENGEAIQLGCCSCMVLLTMMALQEGFSVCCGVYCIGTTKCRYWDKSCAKPARFHQPGPENQHSSNYSHSNPKSLNPQTLLNPNPSAFVRNLQTHKPRNPITHNPKPYLKPINPITQKYP